MYALFYYLILKHKKDSIVVNCINYLKNQLSSNEISSHLFILYHLADNIKFFPTFLFNLASCSCEEIVKLFFKLCLRIDGDALFYEKLLEISLESLAQSSSTVRSYAVSTVIKSWRYNFLYFLF